MKSADVIDFIGSEGLEAELLYNSEAFSHFVPRQGLINDGNFISPLLEKCIPYLNDKERITKPLKRTEAGFVEISFSEAFDIIEAAIKHVHSNENAFFAGARMSNEAMYLVQKLARAGVKSNNIGSFHYFGRNATHYNIDKNDNVQFSEIENATSVILLGEDLKEKKGRREKEKSYEHKPLRSSDTHPKLERSFLQPYDIANIPDCFPHRNLAVAMAVNSNLKINVLTTVNYYHFIKALNYHIVVNNLQQGIFVEEIIKTQFPKYKERILTENLEYLLEKAGVSAAELSDFADFYLKEKRCIIIYYEKDVSSHTVRELLNLCLLTEKSGFPSSGILSLKEKNNAQGLFDMGLFSHIGTGGNMFTDLFVEMMKNSWKVGHVATEPIDNEEYFYSGKSKNLFIFGEDPLGCLKDGVEKKLLDKSQFIMVQDYFLTETALKADIILPDTFPFETGGSFTNTIKIVQSFPKSLPPPVELDHLQQLSALCQRFGLPPCNSLDDIFLEMVSFLKTECSGGLRHQLIYTEKDSNNTLFASGCDDLMRKCETCKEISK